MHRRRADVLAYFDSPTLSGPIEAISGRLEGLRRYALGLRNLTHYRIRSLLHCGTSPTRSTDSRSGRGSFPLPDEAPSLDSCIGVSGHP
ncbi:transposase (plasmid) [Rhodococcus sp. LW-XY12]|nr:transposase [Rhodococcus sp. LW-XY12]